MVFSMARRTARERRQERTRDEILSAALELVIEHGMDKLQMRQIADRVDYSIGGLYEYFSGKDEIIAAIESLSPSGSTYAEEGIRIGYEMAEKPADLPEELAAEREKVIVATESLEVLRIAVNDKQPDLGAVAFIDRALRQIRGEKKGGQNED